MIQTQDAIGKNKLSINVPPHSLEAERSVIGGLMLDNSAWDKIADRICEHDFYHNKHKTIFNTIANLIERNQPFDVLTLSESLKIHNRINEIGGENYLFELAKNVPSAANIIAYADIVRERSILRQMVAAGSSITEDAFNPDGRQTTELLDAAEQKVFAISEQKSRNKDGAQNIKQLLTKAVNRIDEMFRNKGALTGLSTGFTDLDEKTSGLQPSDLIIVAGRPSMGKTAFAMNIAENAAISSKKPVLIFSLEMPGDALALRMMSSLGRIDQHKVRTGALHETDWSRLTSTVSMLSEAPLFIDDSPSLSPVELRARARRVYREKQGLGLIVIDYLQLMQVPGFKENRTLEISAISRSLKALAKELNVPILALSQLNRSLEQRADKRPIMSDLRDSGAIEQDADIVAFIYRDEVYNEDTPHKGQAEIIIAKQRNGPIGKINLTFLGKYTRFENFTENRWDPPIKTVK